MTTPPPRPVSLFGRVARALASVALGTVVTLAVLEIVLHFGYAGFVYFQARRNAAAIASGQGDVRILCVGESTTAVAGDDTGKLLVPRTAYPAQLQEVLNTRQSARTFQVLNNGIMGGTTGASIELLEHTLDTVKPNIIIAMMGIKDTPSEWVPVATPLPPLLAQFDSVKLLSWLIEDVKLRQNANVTQIQTWADMPAAARAKDTGYGNYIRELRPLADPGTLDRVKAAVYLYHIGRTAQAEELLRALIAGQGVGYTLLSDIIAGDGRYDEAFALMDEAVARHPEDGFYRIQQAHLRQQNHEFDAARAILADTSANLGAFADPAVVALYLLVEAAEVALAEDRYDDALALASQVTLFDDGTYRDVLPRLDVVLDSIRGRAYIGRRQWPEAEAQLLDALSLDPRRHVNMWLLSSVYRATGQTDKEEQIRWELLSQTGRVAEYFELAKLFRLTGQADRVPEVLAEAVKRTPSLKQNYARLYQLAEQQGIQLIIMQYPAFELEALYPYAPPKPGVVFIDNLHVFDADPDGYFFQPTYPQSFTHYTNAGSRVLAEHVADTVLGLYATPAASP